MDGWRSRDPEIQKSRNFRDPEFNRLIELIKLVETQFYVVI